MKQILTYIVAGLLGVTSLFLGIRLYTSHQEYAQLKNQYVETLTSANLEIGRARTVLGNSNLMMEKLSKDLQDQVKANNATVERYARLIAKLQSDVAGELETPTSSPPLPPEIKNLPFSYKDFRLSVDGDLVTKKFNYTLSQKFSLDFLELKDRKGKISHLAKLFELNDKNEIVAEANLTDFNVIVSDLNTIKKFEVWNPKADLGLAVSVKKDSVTSPQLGLIAGLSFMSYGEKKLPTWRFGRVNVSYSSDATRLGMTPILLNIAEKIPILDNLYMGLGASVDLTGDKALDFSMSGTL